MSTPQEKAQCVSWFIETKSDTKHSETLDESMEESHLRDLPFEHGKKSLWSLVVCYRERELANLKYQKKRLNLFEWNIQNP